MARAKKIGKRVNINLAKDAYDLLAEYAAEHRVEMTYALEHMIRLFVPMMRKKTQAKTSKSQTASQP